MNILACILGFFALLSITCMEDLYSSGSMTAAVDAATAANSTEETLTGEAAIEHLQASGQYESVQEAFHAARHEVRAVEGEPNQAYLQNPSNGLRAELDPQGLHLTVTTPEGKSYDSRWQLQGLGRGTALTAVGAGELQRDGSRAEILREGVTEWFVNRSSGLEHGFTIAERPAPAGSEGLVLELSLEGDLKARAATGGQRIDLLDAADGRKILDYDKLMVWDADGKNLTASMSVSDHGAVLRYEVNDLAARYPLTVDPTFTQEAYLKGKTPITSGSFGVSVAISGDTAVFGASDEDAVSGAAYVFTRSGTTWSQQAYLRASNAEAGDRFGQSVAISGDTVVVGAGFEDGDGSDPANNSVTNSGAVYVYVRSGTTWSEQAYLKTSNAGSSDGFGYSVVISGDTVVVGANFEDSNGSGPENNSLIDSGAAYVFVRPVGGTTWSEQAYLKASNPDSNDYFGYSVAISGDTVVVSARYEGSDGSGPADNSLSSSGAAYVFVRSGAIWSEQAYLKASNPGASDFFGTSVAISGDTVVVGAFGEDSNGSGPANNGASGSGAAYVFVRPVGGTTWSEQAYLKASNPSTSDSFGISAAISGDTVVVGAYFEDSDGSGPADSSAPNSGAAYVFVRPVGGTTWSEQDYLKASNPGVTDFFGGSVAISGDTVVVGAFGEDSDGSGSADNSLTNSGAGYVFVRPVGGTTWSEQAYVKADNAVPTNGGFGISVAISGDTAVFGAPGGGNDAGAAYVFVRSGTMWSQQAYLKASNEGADDSFGYSVAISGDTVVVGARFEDGDGSDPANNSVVNSGAAYVYVRSGTTWSEQAYLKASNPDVSDSFGSSVAISGDTVVIGANHEDSDGSGSADNSLNSSGAAYVFVRPVGGTTWSEQAYLKASNPDSNDFFGFSVAISGDTVAVGARYEDSDGSGPADNNASGSGAAYVFVRPVGGTTWSEQAYLKASNPDSNDSFGYSVAISGNTVVVCAFGEDSDGSGPGDNSASGSGAAYVFVRPVGGATWSEQAYLKASNPDTSDLFGQSVAISGDTVVVGSGLEDSNGSDPADNSASNSGAAYVFVRPVGGTTWSEQAYLKASNLDASDLFGRAVAISGDTVVVGAFGEGSDGSGQADNSSPSSGAGYAFILSAGTPPTITLNGPSMLTLECGVDTYTELNATGFDLEDGPLAPTITGSVVDDMPGVYVLTYTVTDSDGATAQVIRTVTVQDTLAPFFTALPSRLVVTTTGTDSPVDFSPFPAISDSCDPSPTLTLTDGSGSVSSGDTFPQGLTIVAATATDGSGNTSVKTFEVVVVEYQAPDDTRSMASVVLRGDESAEFTGSILNIDGAFINNDGDVIYGARLNGAGVNDEVVVHQTAPGARTTLAVKGTASGVGDYGTFKWMTMNDSADIGFESNIGTSAAQFFGNGGASVSVLEGAVAAVPINGNYASVYQPALASGGDLLSPVRLQIGSGTVTNSDDTAIISSAGTAIVREGAATNIANTDFGQLHGRVVTSDAAGLYAFSAFLVESLYDASTNTGLFVGNLAGGTPDIVVREGDAASGTSGATFSRLQGESINSSSEIAFRATLEGGGVTAANNEGIWTNTGDNSAPPVLVAREGDPIISLGPAGAIAFDRFTSFHMNDDGSVVFFAYLKNASGLPVVNTSNDGSVWSWSEGNLILIAREGGAANGTEGGRIRLIRGFDCSNTGGVVIDTTLVPNVGDTTTKTNQAVFIDSGAADFAPIVVMRRYDQLMVNGVEQSVVGIDISTSENVGGGNGGYGRAMNDTGKVVIDLNLSGGESGVFVGGAP